MNKDISHIMNLFQPRRIKDRPYKKMPEEITITIERIKDLDNFISCGAIDASDLLTQILLEEISKYKY